MTVFQSKVNTRADTFHANRADMLALVERLRTYEARAEALSEKRRDRFLERSQLTPRERLTRLLDPVCPVSSCTTWRISWSRTPIVKRASRAAASSAASASSAACAASSWQTTVASTPAQ